MLNRKIYQASKPEMEFHMINIIYAALPTHAQTEKTTFSCKDMTLTKHTRRWTYSALRYFFQFFKLNSSLCFSWTENDSVIDGLIQVSDHLIKVPQCSYTGTDDVTQVLQWFDPIPSIVWCRSLDGMGLCMSVDGMIQVLDLQILETETLLENIRMLSPKYINSGLSRV